MADMSKIFGNEELLQKVVVAGNKEDAKKACKEGGFEVTDADLDEVAGGLNRTQKILIGAGAAVLGVGTGIGARYWWKKRPTRDTTPFKGPLPSGEPAHGINAGDLQVALSERRKVSDAQKARPTQLRAGGNGTGVEIAPYSDTKK